MHEKNSFLYVGYSPMVFSFHHQNKKIHEDIALLFSAYLRGYIVYVDE